MTRNIKMNGTAENIIANAEIKDNFAIIFDDLTIIKLNEYTVLVSIKDNHRRIIGSTNTFDRIASNLQKPIHPTNSSTLAGTPIRCYYLDDKTDMCIREYHDYNTGTETTALYFNTVD